MGCLVAYEVARELTKRKHPNLPKLMLISSLLPPHLIDRDNRNREDSNTPTTSTTHKRIKPIREETREELVHRLKVIGGTPREVLENEGFLDMILPPFQTGKE